MTSANVLSAIIVGLGKCSVVILAGFLLIALQRRRRMSDRALWAMVFAAVLAMPALEATLPLWNVPLLAISHGQVDATISVFGVRVSLLQIVFVVWAMGVLVAAVGLVVDHLRARRLIEAGEVAPERLERLLTSAQLAVGRTIRPRIVVTDMLSTPALTGLRHPVILIPRECLDWEEDELLAALCHELFHLVQRDLVANIFERAIAALIWMNPLIHAARRHAALAREVAADRAAIMAGVSPDRLARRMLQIAREGQAHRTPVVALTLSGSRPTHLEARIRALFVDPSPRAASAWSARGTVLCFSMMVFITAATQVIICLA